MFAMVPQLTDDGDDDEVELKLREFLFLRIFCLINSFDWRFLA